MLKAPEPLRELEYLRRTSLSPQKISMFLDIIRNDWGFNIYRAVSDTNVRLSSAATATFVLRLGELNIEQEISRRDFDLWIADDIARIERTVDQLPQAEGVPVDEVDSGFLTGGSSFIPAVRRVFVARCGTER